MSEASCVYWIHAENHTDILTQGYIGFTSKPINKRTSSHRQNYRRFIKTGNKGGCVLLYKNIKDLGGWCSVKVDVLCYGDSEYCLALEEKLRPEPNIGWNIRVGGDSHVMHKRVVTEDTKKKLVEVRKTWTMCQETRDRLSLERRSSGNPMFGTKAWEMQNSDFKTWFHIDKVFEKWVKTRQAVRRLSKEFPELNYWSLDTAIRKFREGWNPTEDADWLSFKESYNES